MKLKKHCYGGKLIVFEGTDGAGKTTLINLTESYLKGVYGEGAVITVKQPTDLSRKTKLFQKMMYSPCHDDIDYRAVQLLTMSDRIQHSFEVIEPNLREGKIVISDRYIFTSLVNMLARGYTRERWFFSAVEHIIKPDATFLCYVDPTLAVQRIKNRPDEATRHLDEVLLKNVAKGFLKIAKKNDFTVLDTSLTPEIPFEVIKNKLSGVIK